MATSILVGATVVTSDGKELGRVKKVDESAFLVDAPRQFDYWLSNEVAASATEERIDLSIGESDLAAYKMDNPHDHNEFRAKAPKSLDPGTVQGKALRQ